MDYLRRPLLCVYQHLGRTVLSGILGQPYFSVDRTELRDIATEYMTFDGDVDPYTPSIPRGPDPTPEEIVERNRELRTAPAFVCELTDVEVVGTEGLAITADNRFLLEEMETSPGLVADVVGKSLFDAVVPVRRAGLATRYNRPVSILFEQGTDGYYHWVAEYLPRVRGIERYAEATGTYPDVLIPSDAPDWKRESLQRVGVPDERLVSWNGHRLRADRLIVPSMPRHGPNSNTLAYTSSPTALRWVSKRLREQINVRSGNTERVLITRRNAPTRRLVNESEVVETLSPFGFEPYVLDEMTIAAQVRLFARAEAVVAPHGAGLVNTIFSDGIGVLELFGDHRPGIFYDIAGMFDFTYEYRCCDDVDGNIHVDTDTLETAVENLLDALDCHSESASSER